MHIRTETSYGSTLGDARMRLHRDPAPECDLCGRPVRRETASERIHRGADGFDVVFVCGECGDGTD